ncbi:MAG TPA: hypothetical protein VFU23_10475, partial [Gemmatimonadales bacterium]|nr:hypothetical protein [Gemmatimonadales bacterium]
MRRLVPLGLVASLVSSAAAQGPRFEITVPASAHAGPLTGRLVLVLARKSEPEPRYTISPSGPALFAIDLAQQPAGRAAVIDGKALGLTGSLNELPPGDYFAQAVINVYEEAHRSDGKRIWV